MINNPGIQVTGLLAWDGSASRGNTIKNHVDFGFVFEVLTTLTADAVFVPQFAPPSDADECVAGTYADASANAVCAGPDFDVSAPAEFRIPSGTVAGTICSATVPCRDGRFLRLRHVSGGANVRAVMLLAGPKN